LVKFLVINPIAELVGHIRNPGEREKIGKFMSKLRKREYDRQFKRDRWIKKMEKRRHARNKKKLAKLAKKYKEGKIELADVRKFQKQMHEPKHYPVEYVDEVEELCLLFSKFFRLSTDNAEYNIRSKLENIYNFEEFERSGNKDLIASNYLLRKIVMMYHAEECRNFLHDDVGAFLTEMRGWLRRSNGEVDSGGGAFVDGLIGAPLRPGALPVVEEEDDSEEDEEAGLLAAEQIDVGLSERSGKRNREPPRE